MNIQNIITEIEKIDPEVYDRLDSRRGTMQHLARWGGRIALTALPFALGGLFKKAYGQSAGSGVAAVLNYALTLEYLEAEFYTKGAASGVVPAGTPAVGAINTIRDHENAHVAFLKSTLNAIGTTPVSKPTFDFTAGGAFADVFTNYDTFLAVAQTFEDTGVRAYKGRAAELISNHAVLTAALQIHAVEARHASHIRQMRKARGASLKPWITGKDTGGIGAAVQASYNGEELTTQAGVDITKFASINAASESFDEPLTADQVLAIVKPFIV
ncbi:ferritin-like domain-containing protein [Chitinophaga sp. 22536]|uniref:ferritin-like domain-containing protein n=1 Tax=unclassified Chitinophaga TaxID=2619133 RepID=UPI003F8800DF